MGEAENEKKPEKPECDQCHSRGWLWFRAFDKKLKTTLEYIVGCATCFGFKADIGTARRVKISTRTKLEMAGHEIWPYEKFKTEQKFNSLNEMTAAVGQSVEDEIPF